MAKLGFYIQGPTIDTTANPAEWVLPDADVPDLSAYLTAHPNYGVANQVVTGQDEKGNDITRDPTFQEMVERAFEGFVKGHTAGMNAYRKEAATKAALASVEEASAVRE